MSKPSYLQAAFNARPFGMPVPPNWFFIAAFGLLGALVNPGLWLIGLGLEGLYLWMLSKQPRFRQYVDSMQPVDPDWNGRYQSVAAQLGSKHLNTQKQLEAQAAEIVELLGRVGAGESQTADVRHMVWLHMKLLAARSALMQVLDRAVSEQTALAEQELRLKQRLQATAVDDELHRSLQSQLDVIHSRREAHASAERRCELVDAELERLRQQIALVREQALLATDEQSVAHSLDALSASLNEANRWLKDQRELFAGLDDFNDEPPVELLKINDRAASARKRTRERGERE